MMKKIFFVFLISGLCLNSMLAMSAGSETETFLQTLKQEEAGKVTDQTRLQKFMSKISEISEKFSNAPEKIKAAFNWIADRIDTILTKKGAIKTLLILGPLFTAYCYFFTPEPVKNIIAYICSRSAKGAVDVGASMGTGVVSGVMQGAKDNWWELLKIGGATSLILTTLSVPGAFIMECVKQAAPIITKLVFLKMHLIISQPAVQTN